MRRAKVLRPTSAKQLAAKLTGAKFLHLHRRGKYLLFDLKKNGAGQFTCLGHLGMTGRMFLARQSEPLPKHAAVVLDLGRKQFVYEDQRYFGKLSLDASSLARMGPEPLGNAFTIPTFTAALAGSKRAIKVRLLDQDLVAGVGNIYASEALHRARIKPQLAAGKLKPPQIRALRLALRAVLTEAIRFGSTIPLHHGSSAQRKDGLFYYGLAEGTPDYYEERLRVYARAGQPCRRCKTTIRRIVQAARSTFYCPHCQS